MLPIMRQILTGGGLVKRGLVAYYDFVQGADSQILYDKSGNGNNGTLGSTSGADATDPTWTSQGASFDGGDYIVCGNPTIFQISDAVTMIVVFRYTGSVADTYSRIFSKEGGYALNINSKNPTGTLRYYSSDTDIGFTTSPINLVENTVFCAGITAKKGTINGYLNGSLIGSQSPVGSDVVKNTANNLMLGNRAAGDRALTGTIYSALLYNAILTDKEVKQTYKYLKKQLAQRGVALA